MIVEPRNQFSPITKFLFQTVDNRGQDDEGSGGGGNQLQRQNSKGEAKEDGGALQATPIEKLIHTKWAESKITFTHAIEPAKLNL